MEKTTQEICPLTGSPADIQSFPETGITIVKSNAIGGTYGYLYDENVFRGNLVQFHLNCARRTLQVIRENPEKKVIPVWTNRSNVNNLKKFFSERREEYGQPPKIICAVEDAKEEYVDHSQKPLVLLESVAKRLNSQGAFSQINLNLQDQVWARILDKKELLEVLTYLKEAKYIKFSIPTSVAGLSEIEEKIFSLPIQMTVIGWEKIRELNQRALTNKVFIATQFSWPDNDQLRIDALEKIRQACSELGYDANVVSQNHTGNITDKIVSEIKSARFVIAELTYNNKGVYYEAGLARGCGIPVYHLVHRGFIDGKDSENKKMHFDIQQIMFREWTDSDDLYIKLKDWLRATIGSFKL